MARSDRSASFGQQVAGAAQTMRGLFPETPLQENLHLSGRYGARILLKREDLSPVRSYKIRGAFNFIRKALADAPGGASLVCASAGNHAQGFAFVCRHFGRRGVVFMPVTTPQQKIDKTRIFGGEFVEIRLVGDFFDECYRAAIDHAQNAGAKTVDLTSRPTREAANRLSQRLGFTPRETNVYRYEL